MDMINTTISAAVVPLVALAGGRAGSIIASTGATPDWANNILGPLGALAGTLVAICWLVKRLNKQDDKSDERDKKREQDIAALATIAAHNQTIIEQNSAMLKDSTWAIEKCRQCEVKFLIQSRTNDHPS